MLRVLYVSHSTSLDGATKVLVNLVSAFEKKTVQPLVVFPENGPILHMMERAGIPFKVIDVGHLGWEFNHIPMLQLLFQDEKPDCIHANTTISYPAILAAKLASIPVVWHIHEMFSHREYYPFQKVDERLLRESIRNCDRICIASEAGKDAFLNYWKQHDIDVTEKIQLITYGIDFPKAAPAPEASEMIISAVGNFVPLKGFDFLVQAFADVVRDFPQTRLRIVGKIFPEYFCKLYKMAEELGILENVSFITETSDIDEIYKTSHLVVCASLIETFPMVVLEALSFGKPVVATQVGGIPEIIHDKKTGLLVPPGDPAALARALRFCLENWDAALLMGEEGRRLISEQYSLALQARSFAAVYEELVQNKKDKPNAELNLNELRAVLYDHMVSESAKLHRLEKTLEEQRLLISANTETIKKVIEDVRTLEGVVSNLLNKWPFRAVRALKGVFVPNRR